MGKEIIKWYYRINGTHTHVRCFMNGCLVGNLCFRNSEFGSLQKEMRVKFIEDTVVNHRNTLAEQADKLKDFRICKACGCPIDKHGCGCNPHDA